MNKTAIKNFAIWARNKLIADISYRAGLMGITESGIAKPLPQSTGATEFYDIGTVEPYSISGHQVAQRGQLVEAIRRKERDTDYKTAYNYVMEEVAYTWFNRLIAVRFMEVNDYLPSHIRVLSSETGKLEPDLVTTPFDADLPFTAQEEATLIQMKQDNKLDEAFRLLFIKQCNALNEILPALFEVTGHYTELLLNLSVIDQDGVVWHLVHDIDEVDWTEQVEIIGWLYQYYISEKHDQIVNIYKGTVKKDEVPAATQLFTTDWVVRYMVDNSLGRYWIERHPKSSLADKLTFFVKPKNEELSYVDDKVEPQDLTFFDPCMGSGHILVYAFDVLMEIYEECGYTRREAASEIVEKNLYGFDIDNRCSQLAYFSVMMKARSYDRRFFTRGIQPQTYYPKCDVELTAYGSLTNVTALKEKPQEPTDLTIFNTNWEDALNDWNCRRLLSQKYAVVCTNPPYLNKYNDELKTFVTEQYKAYSGDLFSVYMFRNFGFCKEGGYSAFMTPFVWMFIKTYENLRRFIIESKKIATLIQMEYSAFEEATVPICTFVLKNGRGEEPSLCFRLSDFKGGMEVQKNKVLEALAAPNCDYFYEAHQSKFTKIPGAPIAYWVSDAFIRAFDNQPISTWAISDGQTKTGDNNKYLRFLWEVPNNKIGKGKKWALIAKGGNFRRWAGNVDTVIDWSPASREHYRKDHVARIAPEYIWFRKGVCWNHVTSGNLFAARYIDEDMLFETAAPAIFFDDENLLFYVIGYLNSPFSGLALRFINPTISTNVGDITSQPLIIDEKKREDVIVRVKEAIALSQSDWDAFETSLNFDCHPLVRPESTVAAAFDKWQEKCAARFVQLKDTEEALNYIFINIYGLQNELTPNVKDKDVTIRLADKTRDVKSLLSYAVGCMFGRYSLDVNGLAYAGGEWDTSKYSSFIPDADNVIPITDEEYLEDDIISRLCQWLKVVYGEDTLEQNLDFIASALGNKGDTSREVIRNYFLKDFFKDHCQIYQKRPIYWLFDSGKQNGFKALIYLHRYNADTIGNLRIDYLHRMQRVYESETNRMQDTIDHSGNAREVAQATKRKEKLQKQLKECREYDEKISHLALARIELDLDDGVKVNYEKVQTARDGKKYSVLAKI